MPLPYLATAPTLAAPAAARPDLAQQLADLVTFSIAWLRLHTIDIAIAGAAGLLIYVALRTARRYIRKAAAKQVDHGGFAATTLRVLSRTRRFFMVMVSIRLVAGYADPPPLVAQTIRFLFIVAVAVQVAVWVRAIIMSVVRSRASSGAHETLGNALSLINVLVSIALFAIAGIVVLDNVGVNVTGLIAGLGIGGIAIGLAAKGVFEDLFAALAIIFDRPFRVGESIKFGTTQAKVERIGLKSTRLRALTGEQVVISNTNLLNQEIANYANLERRRMMFKIGITYETPTDRLRRIPEVTRALIEADGHRLVRCGFVNFGDSTLDFEVQFDVLSDDYEVVFAARHTIGITIIDEFARHGIGFAYPVQVTGPTTPLPASHDSAPSAAPAPADAVVPPRP